jgi:hypothetical protein
MGYKTETKEFKIVMAKPQGSTQTKGIPYLECITDKGEVIRFWGSKLNMVHIDIIKKQTEPFYLKCDCFIDVNGPADYWVHETEHKIYLEEEIENDPLSINRKPLETALDVAEGQQGISYDILFRPYLVEAKLIRINDPYIRLAHQIRNLIDFCQCVVPLVPPQDNIKLEVITMADSNEQELINSEKFNGLKKHLIKDRILFTYKFDKTGHDRWIETDIGWRIDLSRGLDIFQKPEDTIIISFPQIKRPCKATTITYRKMSPTLLRL